MKILGIDPGLRVTGFGVIQKEGMRLTYIASGTIRIPDGDLPSRLKVILDGVGEIVRTYQPDCAAIEIIFSNVNPQSTLLLGQARGAAICGLPARQRSPWAERPQPAPLDETFGMRQAVRLLGQMRDLVRRRKNSKGVSPLSGCLLARLLARDWLASGDRRFACYGASREWQVAARARGARS